MANEQDHIRTGEVSADERQSRRAFRHAMSSGLKRTYDGVASKSVPEEFLLLLQKADANKAKA
jgi:hypothetical protein